MTEEQDQQCKVFGFYTESEGYRRVPGDLCTGGVDLNPRVMTCGYGGLIFGIVSMRNLILALVICAVIYYGWPFFEAIIVKLPIPDPKDMKEKISGVFSSIKERSKGKVPNKDQYKQGFEQRPESLNDEEDEEEAPFGNNGKKGGHSSHGKGKKNTGLNYDSDEDKNQESELIDLDGGSSSRDRTNTAAEKIPKL